MNEQDTRIDRDDQREGGHRPDRGDLSDGNDRRESAAPAEGRLG